MNVDEPQDAGVRNDVRRETSNVWLKGLIYGFLGVVVSALALRAVNVAIALLHPKGPAYDVALQSLPIAPETADKFVWLCSLVCGAVLLATARHGGGSRLLARPPKSVVLLLAGLTGLFLGVAWIEPLDGRVGLWMGFGTNVLLLAIALVPALYLALHHPDARIVRFLALASVAFASVVYLPSVLQPIWGVINSFHSGYIFNELLAPTQGHFLLGTQIPQYTSLFGLPLGLLWRVFPGLNGTHAPGALMAFYLTGLALVTLGGLVLLAYRVLPVKLRALALLLMVPLVLVKVQPPTTEAGSIAVLFSALPIRTLPVIAVGLLLTVHADRGGVRRSAAVGVAAGLAALNNFEFGVPCAIAALLALWLSRRDLRSGIRALAAFVAAALAPFLIYALALYAVGQPLQWRYWIAFSLNFADGFGSVPMPIVGPHLLVLSILIAGVTSGAYFLRAAARGRQGESQIREHRAALTALFFGLAGLGSFGYYVGRSVISGQLQVFLFYIAPIIAANLTLLAVPRLSERAKWSDIGATALILFPAALAVAVVLQAPDARQEWSRVALTNKSGHEFSILDAEVSGLAKRAAAARQTSGSTALATAVHNGNYLEAYSGLPNYSAIDSPGDAWLLSPFIRAAFCRRLSETSAPILVEGFYNKHREALCPGYTEALRISGSYSVIKKATKHV